MIKLVATQNLRYNRKWYKPGDEFDCSDTIVEDFVKNKQALAKPKPEGKPNKPKEEDKPKKGK